MSGIVAGYVHRIFNATSSWDSFHKCLSEAKDTLSKNQYPSFYVDKIIHAILSKILEGKKISKKPERTTKSVGTRLSFCLEYRGHVTERLAKAIKSSIPSINNYFTTRKLRTCLFSAKSVVSLPHRSNVVYEITCSCCRATYIGPTTRHLLARAKEHSRKDAPVTIHRKKCNITGSIDFEDVKVLDSATGLRKLMALESLYIRRRRPTINTRDEYRSRPFSYVF